MKALKSIALIAGIAVSSLAMAADPIVGSWKMSEKGTEKVIINIVDNGGVYSGRITRGLTKKAEKTVGSPVLKGVKAVGGGKYKGTGIHPTWGITASVDITVNGNSITIKSWKGTQTGVRQ